MTFRAEQLESAVSDQQTAARDPSQQIRVVAGPGTGKSSAIEERVKWLLEQGVLPTRISVVSFTRASARDLERRVGAYGERHGVPQSADVRVSTLHALALRTLRAAGLLGHYPADPLILDDWELEQFFDSEFREVHGFSKSRSEDIRREHEAFWSTGQWTPPNYVPPSPPISSEERQRFESFHGPRTQTYSCVLPGELVRKCVEQIEAGLLNPVDLLSMEHLIVDEYQDLNPIDLKFIDAIAELGVPLFVAGDDDQSIYSFRHASPAGIQTFHEKYPECGQHTLTACFRSTPSVLDAAQSLIAANSAPGRIEKTHTSLYRDADPPLQGIAKRWTFTSGTAEARAIAKSCQNLIEAGTSPKDILILLSNKRQLLPAIIKEFASIGIPVETPRNRGFLETDVGRFTLSILRIVRNHFDYIAHRVLLGALPNVGVGTTNSICESVIENNLNYLQIFYDPLPVGVFSGRPSTALGRVREICRVISDWEPSEVLLERSVQIGQIIMEVFGRTGHDAWQEFAPLLPNQATLEEFRDYLWADTDEQQEGVLQGVYRRLDLPLPEGGLMPDRVRVMTMHGSKGLSAKIVFVPGLEADIFPGPKRDPYPGLVLEGARLLYVAITRARAACYLSWARSRLVHGTMQFQRSHSRFCTQLGGAFEPRTGELTPTESQELVELCSQL